MLLQYVILCLLLSFTSASEYCAMRYSRLCQEKGQHIACQYPFSGKGESCENYTKIEFTEEIRNLILHYINRHRQRLASGHERARGGLPIPKPDIMMYVEWDRELAYLAQRLADQCRFVHDECRATVRYPYAGQTVGEVRWRSTRDSDELTAQRAIRKVFDAWWGEKRRVQPQQLTSPFKVAAKGAIWGHFTQLAVWKLRAVGCGAVRYGPSHPRLLLVCDYSHTNMLGQKTFTAGPLATCPPHTARRPHSQYPLLCSKIKYPEPQYEIDKFDYEIDDSKDKETIQSEKTEEYNPDDAEEEVKDHRDITTGYKDSSQHAEMDIYVKRIKSTGQYRKQESREEENQREASTEEEYKDTDIYVQTRSHMKNVHEYQQERRTSTMRTNRDFEEERSNDIFIKSRGVARNGKHNDLEVRRKNMVQNNRDRGYYEKKSDSEEKQRNSIVQNYRDAGDDDKNNDFEEELRNYIMKRYRDGGQIEKKSNFEERRNNIVQSYRDGDNTEKKSDFEEERRNSIVQSYRDGDQNRKKSDFEEERSNNIVRNNKDYEKKIPHLSDQDYSVIPLQKQNQNPEQGEVNIPWRPKLYHRTSTTEVPEYETSIILVPKRKKGHRISTATAGTLPPNVMRNILRTYHNGDREPRPSIRVREKDLHTIRRPLVPSLKLDKEDIEQLFRDTGFKPSWTQEK